MPSALVTAVFVEFSKTKVMLWLSRFRPATCPSDSTAVMVKLDCTELGREV